MELIVEVKPIKFSLLNNDEYAQFVTGVVNLAEIATLEKLFIDSKDFNVLKKKLDDLTEVGRQTRGSKETQRISELDKSRSDLVVFLLSLFRVEQKNIVSERKEAAKALYKECKNYLGIQSLPIRQKSHAISGLIKDLEKDNNKKHTTTLGVLESVASLKNYNQEVQKLIEGRAENQLVNTLPNAKKLRNEISELYKHITKCAYAMNIINKTEESSNFINLLNKLVEDTSFANKQRLAQIAVSKKSANDDKKQNTEPNSKDIR